MCCTTIVFLLTPVSQSNVRVRLHSQSDHAISVRLKRPM